ncbi:MAG: hypothetical protein GTO02_18625 [Candidatus Dadabacteria bacterium]|nr:hypothetical protein [Candidatus Dadabacteria bacterium]NIQ16326.1 hypothetical protein [Candidatus Dadabacteria bacterium]
MNKKSLTSKYRGDFVEYLSLNNKQTSEYTEILSDSRVYDIDNPIDDIHIKLGSSDNSGNTSMEKRELYDGIWLQRKLFKFLNTNHSDEVNDKNLHLIFTSKLIVTYGEKRYHARVVLTGTPSIISTSGLIEGPARPREYYWLKANFVQSGKDFSELDDLFADRYLTYGDERIANVLCSYTLQSIFYHYLGEQFCNNNSCSLYNSHWQEEVLSIHAKNIVCEDCQKKLDIICKLMN